jgi:hypothetical protein
MTGAWVEKNEEVEDVGVAVSSDSEMHRGFEEPHLRKGSSMLGLVATCWCRKSSRKKTGLTPR